MRNSFTGLAMAILAVGAVLAFGAVNPRTMLVVELLIALVALAEFWRNGLPRMGRFALFVVVLLVILPLVQLLPLPSVAKSGLGSSQTTRLQILQNWHLGEAPSISVQREATVEGETHLICYLLFFLLAFSDSQLHSSRLLPRLLLSLGLFEALYGLVQYLTGFQYIFGYAKRYYIEDATGTYINRNHYAGFLEMVLPFLLAVILFSRRQRGEAVKGWTAVFTDESFAILRRVIAFSVVFIALVFSRSRMGILSAAVGLAITGMVAVAQKGRQTWPVLAILIIAATCFSLWVGVGPVASRFQATDPSGSDTLRVDMWKDAIAMIRDQPFLGTGLGTYSMISPFYQTQDFQYRIDHPHNDYLEWAAEVGAPMALLLFGSLWWIAIRLVLSTSQIESQSDLVMAAGCSGALVSLLMHSLADFNTQIPANAMLLAWIAGAGSGLLWRIGENRG